MVDQRWVGSGWWSSGVGGYGWWGSRGVWVVFRGDQRMGR